jgi:imidazolonepropionase-like amidohydrolase
MSGSMVFNIIKNVAYAVFLSFSVFLLLCIVFPEYSYSFSTNNSSLLAKDLPEILPLHTRTTSSVNIENNDGPLVLQGATLIDGTGASPISNAVIVINGSKITTVTNQTDYHRYRPSFNDGDETPPVNVRVRNLTGKYVIPGLFDMHAHVAGVRKGSYNQTISEKMLVMLLDYGITTIRNPGGPTNESVSLRKDVQAGTIRGPEIFTAGRLLNTPKIPVPFVEKQVTTEEEAREEVQRQAAAGVDYVKLYVGLTPALLKAAIDEAHSQGIKVIGHLYLTSWTDAANLGIDALTHGVPVSPFLLSEDKQQIFNLTGGGPFDHSLWLDLMDPNSTEIRDMIHTLVENQIPVDPTLNIYEAILKQGSYDPQNEERWNKVLHLTKMMYDSGVKILSGTDIPNFGLVPGKSLHHELELLVEAGIEPMDAIKIATNNGAEALGIINQTGTIKPGKQADIIILSKNPLEDIGNTMSIEAVITDGRVVEDSSRG